VPQGRGKNKRRATRSLPTDGRGASPEDVMRIREAFRPPIDAKLLRGVRDGLDDLRIASKAITAPADPFRDAEGVTRSTLQTGKMSAEERALLDEQAPPYIFRADDALCYRTPNGYKPTGLGALNFPCIAATRAFWRRAFDCQLPTLPDLPAEG